MSEITAQEVDRLHHFVWDVYHTLADGDYEDWMKAGGQPFAEAVRQYAADVFLLQSLTPQAWFESSVRQTHAAQLQALFAAYEQADVDTGEMTENARKSMKELDEALERIERLKEENERLKAENEESDADDSENESDEETEEDSE